MRRGRRRSAARSAARVRGGVGGRARGRGGLRGGGGDRVRRGTRPGAAAGRRGAARRRAVGRGAVGRGAGRSPDEVGGVVPGSEPAPLVPPAPFVPPVPVPEAGGVAGPPPLADGLSDRADRTTDVPQATWLPSVGRDAVTWASSAGRVSPAYDIPSPASVSRRVASAKVMPVTGGTACFCWVSKDLSRLPSLPTGRAIPGRGCARRRAGACGSPAPRAAARPSRRGPAGSRPTDRCRS